MPTYIILPLTHYKTVVYFNSYFAHLYDTTKETFLTFHCTHRSPNFPEVPPATKLCDKIGR
jgi:hypothetical protein